MKPILTLLTCSLFLCPFACRKDKKAPVDQLPPATQTGKNTFGCLINGQAWLPKGNVPPSGINPSASFDATFENGSLIIKAARIEPTGGLSITLNGKEINKEGVYPLGAMGTGASQIARVKDNRSGCYYFHSDNGTYCTGVLEITRLAWAEKIIAGKFSFTIYVTGCDTLKVTDGRFDLRLY